MAKADALSPLMHLLQEVLLLDALEVREARELIIPMMCGVIEGGSQSAHFRTRLLPGSCMPLTFGRCRLQLVHLRNGSFEDDVVVLCEGLRANKLAKLVGNCQVFAIEVPFECEGWVLKCSLIHSCQERQPSLRERALIPVRMVELTH